MRGIRLRTLAVSAAAIALLAGVLFVASTVDTRPPDVVAYRLTQPVLGEQGRAQTTTSLEVVFSEEVDRISAADAFRIEPRVDGALSWSGATMTFTPDEPLSLETDYEAHVGPGVRDLHGNIMAGAADPFAFTTVGRPEVTAADPAPGAEDVPLDTAIILTFSTLMDTASVEGALRLQPAFAHELRWSGTQLVIVPAQPLRPARSYRVALGDEAADVSGVQLAAGYDLTFRTLAAGLEAAVRIPADGSAGIAVTTPIAVAFDLPLDPDAIEDDLIRVTPEIDGSLTAVAAPGGDEDVTTMLVFTPSSALPPNTTFTVRVSGDVRGSDGGSLAEPLEWSFTTGAPLATVSNQITFLSDRSGVTNLWAMNEDGTAQRQLSAELDAVLDYAVAPDGRSFVLADGRRLVRQRADGSQRTVLTDDGAVEYDPTYSPDGRRVAFGRSDAASGEALGLWERSADGGQPRRVELPAEIGASPSLSPGAGVVDTPSPSPDASEPEPPDAPLRAPRYSPDGQALAFVIAGEGIAIVELPAARLTRVAGAPVGAPVWLPDSSAVLVEVDEGGQGRVVSLSRSGTRLEPTRLGAGAMVAAVDVEGGIAIIRLAEPATGDDPAGGRLELAVAPDRQPQPLAAVAGLDVTAAAFGSARSRLAIAVRASSDGASDAGIWLVSIDSDEAIQLTSDGSSPRWHP